MAKHAGPRVAGVKGDGLQPRQLLPLQGAVREGRELALAETSKRKPIGKNRVDPVIEKAVAEMAIEKPAFGQERVANELKKQGHTISRFGGRNVWLRHDLETMKGSD